MHMRLTVLLALMATVAGFGLTSVAVAQSATPDHAFAKIDGDGDGSIDTTEALKAAAAKFDAADADHDGTLSQKELAAMPGGAHLASSFSTIDTDHDGTISKDEYLAAVRAQFAAADPDKDGTVSAAEWKTTKAAPLRSLIGG
jgi:Ca2+-binding EF-hand superfamily protein